MALPIFAAALAGALGAAHAIDGTFALVSGTAKTSGHLIAVPRAESKLEERLDLWLTGSDGGVVRHYDVDMTKYVHLIVISDDFTSFAHVHPVLTPDGHFRIAHTFPRAGLYHVYADCEPSGDGQQVFRFDLAVGSAAPSPRDLVATGSSADTGGYRVSLDTIALRAKADTTIRIRITKGGKLATDLHPYLGALAHAVFIDGEDLTYLHVHPAALGAAPMAMAGMAGMGAMHMDEPAMPDAATSAPRMQLDAHVTRPGTYKLWLQFRGGGSLHVAPFVLHAS